ncbi:MAG TPA: hypothetical protein VHH88_08305, partial [Verrucomicrobiae bacterium]|nr:hypothetical protein [Verrucomicrobiae bacterium]
LTNMKKHLVPIFILAVCLGSCVTHADDAYTNRFTISARIGFNISARFGAIRGLSAPSGTARTTPNGDTYNYDNGYVLTDVSGNFGNQTWYWGYDDSSRQLSGNSIMMNRTTFSGASSPLNADDNGSPGFEIAFNRPLGSIGRLLYGFEIAGNYMALSIHNTSAIGAPVHRVTDTYDYTPGTTPPAATPSGPYQGTLDGPGFVISGTPSSSSSSDVMGLATIVGSRSLDANVWGARVGPNLELPLGNHFTVAASGGFACALVDADVSWSEAVQMGGARGAALSGHGSASGFQAGFYLAALASYQISDRWDIVGGAQYQFLNDFDHSIGGRDIELDFSKSLMVTLGVGFKF